MEGGPIKLDKRGIRSVVRIRPTKPEEEAYIDCEPRYGKKLELEGRSYNDSFSMVLGPDSTQHQVFQAVGLPMADATLRGQNTCLFAYGQSGAGKTFSMYGAEGGKIPSRLDGIVPAICAELFRRKQDVERRGDYKLKLETTIIEVRGATINDLLAEPLDTGGQPQLKIINGEVVGAAWEPIYASRGLTQTIERAMLRRQTGKNYFNSSSSRSHCFLTMRLSKVPSATPTHPVPPGTTQYHPIPPHTAPPNATPASFSLSSRSNPTPPHTAPPNATPTSVPLCPCHLQGGHTSHSWHRKRWCLQC